MQTHEIMWATWDGLGLEHVRIAEQANGISIDGAIIVLDEGQAIRGRYTIRCDDNWRVRAMQLDPLRDDVATLELLTDGAGYWTDGAGRHLPGFDGCIDVDLTLTPLTNTLPIRRYSFAPGESVEFQMTYIDGATLTLSVNPQRYTCLQRDAQGGRYRFESLDTGFQAEIAVDADGFVIDYPPLFRRITKHTTY